MNRIDNVKTTVIVSSIAIVLALVALVFAVQAPETIAASKWLSLPGFSMPAWLPVTFALVACIAAKNNKTTIALLFTIATIAISIATIITVLVFMF